MKNHKQNLPRDPAWWTEEHTSNWDQVKDALERDWEQTKADFSKTGGEELNQNAVDTVQQSMGSEPVPPLGQKTRPTDPKVAARTAEKALENMKKESGKAAETISEAHDDIAREKVQLGEKVSDARNELAAKHATVSDKEAAQLAGKATDKISDAREKAARGIAKAHEKIEEAGDRRDRAVKSWRDAEREVRFGYSVRSRYPVASDWDDKVERDLRVEWDALVTGRPWTAAGPDIHRGWDYAGRKS